MISASKAILAGALALDGEAAKRHAAQLAALGPHPFGSPRSRFAAEYVAAQFRQAGLREVRLQPVEAKDARGANVLGVLRGPGTEFLVLAAHHDTAPDSPGAYGSGGGVGILIEAARALARRADRPRSVVFASFDGREPYLGGRGGLGAGTYVESLGPEGRQLVGALVLDRAGRKGLPVVLETVAYPDPLQPGNVLVAPAALVRASLDGAKAAGETVAVGDPAWSWLYQASVRAFRVKDGGDDRPFLEARLPALRVSARRFLARDPYDLTPADSAEHLDAGSLARVGGVLLGAAAVLQNASTAGMAEGDWFLRFGQVAGRRHLLLAGLVSLVPGLFLALRRARLLLAVRLVHAALFGVVLYFFPVLAVFGFFLWNVLTPFGPRLLGLVLGALPGIALLAVGSLAWSRGVVNGVHPPIWALVAAILAAALALASGRRPTAPRGAGRRKGLPRR